MVLEKILKIDLNTYMLENFNNSLGWVAVATFGLYPYGVRVLLHPPLTVAIVRDIKYLSAIVGGT